MALSEVFPNNFWKSYKTGCNRNLWGKMLSCIQTLATVPAPTTGPGEGLPAWRGEERAPSPLTSAVVFKKTSLPLGKCLHKASFELGAVLSPGNSRKQTCPALSIYHTPWHTEVSQRQHRSTFPICCLWFFATVNISEQLSIIRSRVPGCPKGQWHSGCLFGLDGRR